MLCIWGIIVQNLQGQSPSFQTYINPVIPGDHSDCTLSQIGDDFYTTGSSFNPTPVIYHSSDLIHWEAIAQPVSAAWSNYGDAPQGGCWGGQIVYYNNKYWDFFGRSFQMYFVTADKPEGPWSAPVKMNVPASVPGFGADNSIFIDSDSSWYLLVKNGQPNNWIVELGNDGQPLGAIYNLTWLNPAPGYPYSWAEGPVMWKYKGYYFYSFARDVSGGQKVMRSKTLTGDQLAWTVPIDLFNEKDPDKSKAIFSGPNHSSAAFILNDSTSWVMHPVWARANSNEWYGQGRQGLVNQVHYDSDTIPIVDYPVNNYFTAPKLPSNGIPWMVPKSDFFTSETLKPEWSFLGYTPTELYSLTQRSGWLRLKPKSSNKSNTVIKTDAEHNYSLITQVDFDAKSPNDEAGIRIMNGMENLSCRIYSSYSSLGRKVICFSFDKIYYETNNTIGNTLWLKLVRVNHLLSGFFSSDGINWIQVGKEINVASLDNYTTSYNGWCGNRQGVFVNGSNADFNLYIYRDAYTSILAECPANQYGTARTSLSNGIYLLDSIHNNDWSLYAGVEFGTTDYPKVCDSVQFIASCETAGGNIEVWLDSIDTGTKIATCEISNTGSWTTFNSFTTKTQKVTGRHDVYLKFNGIGNGRLFQLKWINFIPINAPRYISSSTSTDGSLLEAKFSKSLLIPGVPGGFNVLVNNADTLSISSIVTNPEDSVAILIYLQDSIKKDDKVQLSYYPGNFTSKDTLDLVQFCDSTVNNQVTGTKPYITQIITNKEGDSLFITFTKKMNSPDGSLNKFLLSINNSLETNPTSGQIISDDSTTFVFQFPIRFYYENDLKLKYTGTQIKSIDDGILDAFDVLPVTNISYGYPISLSNVTMRKYGNRYTVLDLRFDKEVLNIEDQKDFFLIKINGNAATIQNIKGAIDSIRLSFTPPIVYGDTVLLSYIDGTLATSYNGRLPDIVDLSIENLNIPPVSSIISNIQKNVTVFPNPAKEWLTVKSEDGFKELKIVTILGREVYTQKFNLTDNYTIPFLNLAGGLYILQIVGINTTISTKIRME
jgi:xylan 1,4-beta-xylosidase